MLIHRSLHGDKDWGKSLKMLPPIFLDESESIISIDKARCGLRKNEITDSIEFSSLYQKFRLSSAGKYCSDFTN